MRRGTSVTPATIARKGISVKKMNNRADFPDQIRNEFGAAGPVYQLTAASRSDNRTDDTISTINTFGTGLVITPDPGFVAIVTGSDNLFRTGYFMTSSIIIPSGNMNELVIPLFKFSSSDLELPMVVATMVVVAADNISLKATGSQNLPTQNRNQPQHNSATYSGNNDQPMFLY